MVIGWYWYWWKTREAFWTLRKLNGLKRKKIMILLLIWHKIVCRFIGAFLSLTLLHVQHYNVIFSPLFDSELYRKMQSMCASQIKTVQWTRGGETAASSAVSRNVLQWEWSKKVMQCQNLLKLSVTNVWRWQTGVCNDSLVKPKLGMTDIYNQSLTVPTAENGNLKLIQQLFFKVQGAVMA